MNIDWDNELARLTHKRRVRTIEERMLTYCRRYGEIPLLPYEIFYGMKLDNKEGFKALHKLTRAGYLVRTGYFVALPGWQPPDNQGDYSIPAPVFEVRSQAEIEADAKVKPVKDVERYLKPQV